MRVGNQSLQPLSQGVGGADKQSRPSRGEVERVTGVEHDLASEALQVGESDHVLGGSAIDGQDNQLAELGGLCEGSNLCVPAGFTQPAAQLVRSTRADHDPVGMIKESIRKGPSSRAGAKNADLQRLGHDLVVSAEAAPQIGQGLELDIHNELSRTWGH